MTNIFEIAIIVLLFAQMCFTPIAFYIGVKIGQAAARGEKIEPPVLNPMEIHKRNEARREAEREQKRIDTILKNIDAYDGTSNGQKDVEGI